MARYIGPKSKIARKFREPIFGADKYLEKKNYPPGQHGVAKKRAKQSEYAVQLQEKQKAKYTYGILERQFAIIFDRASRAKGITGEVLLQLIEARLEFVRDEQDLVLVRLECLANFTPAQVRIQRLAVFAERIGAGLLVVHLAGERHNGADGIATLLDVLLDSELPTHRLQPARDDDHFHVSTSWT